MYNASSKSGSGRDQEKLLDELKLVRLRRAVDEGEESLRQHGGIPAEEVFAELEKRAKTRIRKSQQCHSQSVKIGNAGKIVLEPSPGYFTMDSVGKKEQVKKGRPSKLSRTESSRVRKVKQLFEEWLQDSSGYDEETWPELKRALNENHSKSHKLFDE